MALTPDFAKLSISPESSDGFASVGTILPKEEVALLPGDLFVFRRCGASAREGVCPKIRQPQRKEEPSHKWADAENVGPAMEGFSTKEASAFF